MKCRAGLGLVELILVLAVIGGLIALLFPAIEGAREEARRNQCWSNLRRVALALHAYEDAYRVLPHTAINNYSFHVSLLPHLQQQALYQEFDFSLNAMEYRGRLLRQRVGVLECPSDPSCNRAAELSAVTNYHGNWGTGAQRYGNNGIFSVHDDQPGFVRYLPLKAITDGLSRTAMLAEVAASDDSTDRLRMVWGVPRVSRDRFEEFAAACSAAPQASTSRKYAGAPRGRPWLNCAPNWTIYNHILTPNQASCINGGEISAGAFTSTSLHSGVVNVALADASIQGITDEIDLKVWRALGSRAGNP